MDRVESVWWAYIRREVKDRIYTIDNRETYSMVLTKSVFFHTDWMEAYWSPDEQKTALRGYVDEHKCECNGTALQRSV